MNIGLLAKSFGTAAGGIESYTECLSRNLAGLGHTVHIFAAGRDAATREAGGRVYLHSVKFADPSFAGAWRLERFFPYAWLSYARQVRRRIASLPAAYRPEVLESPNWGLDGFWCAVFKDLPVVIRLHVPTPEYARGGVMRYGARAKAVLRLERLLVVRAGAVTSPSRHLAGLIGREYGLRREVDVIPNGVDTGAVPPAAVPESRRPLVLYAGRIERNKGVEYLMRAVPGVLARVPQAEFILAGRFAEKEEVIRQWKTAAGSSVRFTGELSRPALFELYRKCHLCVMPSLSEAFGLTALEAMSFGKPVVASAAGGLPEIVEDGKNGLLVRPGEPSALEGAIVRLLQDREYRQRLGTEARRTVRERFGPAALAGATVRVYEKAIRDFAGPRNVRPEERNEWNDIRGR